MILGNRIRVGVNSDVSELSFFKKFMVIIVTLIFIISSFNLFLPGDLRIPSASAQPEGTIDDFEGYENEAGVDLNFTEPGTQTVYINVSATYNITSSAGFMADGCEPEDLWVEYSHETDYFYGFNFNDYENIMLDSDNITLWGEETDGFLNSTTIECPGDIYNISAEVNCTSSENTTYMLHVSYDNFTTQHNITNDTVFFYRESETFRFNLSINSTDEDFKIYSINFTANLHDYCSGVKIGISDVDDLYTQEGDGPVDDAEILLADSMNVYIRYKISEGKTDRFSIPITVYSATIGTLRLKDLYVPWTTLDLDITDVDLSGSSPYNEGDIVVINVSIENLNQTPVFLSTALYLDSVQESNLIGMTYDSIDGEETIDVNFSWDTLGLDGNYDLIVITDPYNEYLEVNEGNNNYTYSNIVVIGHDQNNHTYDYNLQALSFAPSKGMYYENDYVTFEYSYRNQGWDNIDSYTIRIYKNSSIIYSEDLQIDEYEEVTDSFIWDSSNNFGDWNFTLSLDPLENITEFNESDNQLSYEIRVLEVPDPEVIFSDDYNITNWTFIDNSSVSNGTEPSVGEWYWRTYPGEYGWANLSIPYIDLKMENWTIDHYYINFTSNHNFTDTDYGVLYIQVNNSDELIEVYNFSGKSGGGNESIWYDYSIDFINYIDQQDDDYANSTLIFSVFLEDEVGNEDFWYIDNLSIDLLGFWGDYEDGSEFYLGDWDYFKWEYFEAVYHTGNHWSVIEEDERTCWWSGNTSSGDYLNNMDDLLISPGLSLFNMNEFENFTMNFTIKYYLDVNDKVEFFIVNDTISNGIQFDIFTGDQEEWINKSYNLSQFYDQRIWLVFRFVTNESNVDCGFYLDPIEVRKIDKGINIGDHLLKVIGSLNYYTKKDDTNTLVPHHWSLSKNEWKTVISSDVLFGPKNVRLNVPLTISSPTSGMKTRVVVRVSLHEDWPPTSDNLLKSLKCNGGKDISYIKNSRSTYSVPVTFTTESITIPKKDPGTQTIYLIKINAKVTRYKMTWIGYRTISWEEVFSDTIVYGIPITLDVKEYTFRKKHTIADFQLNMGSSSINNRVQPNGGEGYSLTQPKTLQYNLGSTYESKYRLKYKDTFRREQFWFRSQVIIYKKSVDWPEWNMCWKYGHVRYNYFGEPSGWGKTRYHSIDIPTIQLTEHNKEYKIKISVWGEHKVWYYWKLFWCTLEIQSDDRSDYRQA